MCTHLRVEEEEKAEDQYVMCRQGESNMYEDKVRGARLKTKFFHPRGKERKYIGYFRIRRKVSLVVAGNGLRAENRQTRRVGRYVEEASHASHKGHG